LWLTSVKVTTFRDGTFSVTSGRLLHPVIA